MTLDEAIAHCDEKAKELRNEYEYYDHWDEDDEIRAEDCLECANEHEQLAGWLKELKELKECKGDLISREALKENEPNYDEEGYRIFYESEIDNAPTVTDRTEEVLSLQNTIAKLVEGIAENTRPQGEWAEIEGGYICSNCEDIEAYTPNFCPNCGADMRGGSE